MKADYPTSFDAIQAWATTREIAESEARVRFAQYGILRAISLSHQLSSLLVFKGGNALDFIWQPNRSTRDLDFSVDMTRVSRTIDKDELRALLQGALGSAGRALNIAYRTQRLKRNPPGELHNFATFEVKVGYALQDQSKLVMMIHAEKPVSQVIDLDISLNDVVCDTENVTVAGTHPLRTCTIEDILAEKLRALLQQPIRQRNRAQDLLDIAVCLRKCEAGSIDRGKVATFLLEKASARGVPVSRVAFRDPELIARARQDYDALEATARTLFIPFEEALPELHDFVETLAIPAH